MTANSSNFGNKMKAFFNKPKKKKSKACSKVLRLMDQDYGYEKALRKVLREDKRLSKKLLEEELDFYV